MKGAVIIIVFLFFISDCVEHVLAVYNRWLAIKLHATVFPVPRSKELALGRWFKTPDNFIPLIATWTRTDTFLTTILTNSLLPDVHSRGA
jgi:hypothetical protein